VPVVSGCDTQWRGTFKQRILTLCARYYLHPAISHFMVAGVYQYEWVRKLGYAKDQIVWDLYSGATDKFETVKPLADRPSLQRNLLFVGRLVPQKGLDLLLNVWNGLADHHGWNLQIVGDGPLRSEFQESTDVEFLGYQSQEGLVELANEAAAFILPSNFEPWAVVIHEFAAAGLPLLCSSVCGAVPHLLIHNYNGYTFRSGDSDSLKSSLQRLLDSSDADLASMGERSRVLSRRISQSTSAANLMSIIE
jgi:glycosyltransferase involved in cell wall biosynthesis